MRTVNDVLTWWPSSGADVLVVFSLSLVGNCNDRGGRRGGGRN